MTEREALKLALEWFESVDEDPAYGVQGHQVIAAIKEALAQPEHGWTPERIAGIARLKDAQDKRLAQPEQEPDYYGLTADHLWMSISKDHYDRLNPEYRMTCYTTPPQRKPLTENEIKHLWYEACQTSLELTSQLIVHLARNIEAAHGIYAPTERKGEA